MGVFQRDKWQFYSGCLVFRHPQPHEMYWHALIKPWVHYIPIDSWMDDLVMKIIWAIRNDERCREIAEAGLQFARTHCMPEHLALYSYKVLLRYAQLQGFDPAQVD